MGVVTREHSTAGKQKLLGISKRRNAYLRRLFVLGARAVMQQNAKLGYERGTLEQTEISLFNLEYGKGCTSCLLLLYAG
jgi:hypothetical protein